MSSAPPPALLELLAAGLAELSHPRRNDAAALTSLARLCALVGAWAGQLNLTGHRGPEPVARDLVLDAAALDLVIPSEAQTLADIGSGAGFPGLPVAILRPAGRVTLIESRERRHHFQRHAIRTLGLGNAVALRGRAELLPATGHACAVAQAAAQPVLALRWLARWVAPGGVAVIPGSAARPPDAGEALPPGWSARVVTYQVPLGGRERTAWIARAPSRG